jgi:Icc-related predicted phosphoesterase
MENLRVLAVSDVVQPQLYNNDVLSWLPDVDLIISCGDLPPYYLDFLVSKLDVPMFHVIGNHCYVAHDPVTKKHAPTEYPGLRDLNGRLAEHNGLLMGGIEGSPVYNNGPHQYSEQAVELNLLRMVPGLAHNKVRAGRYLDVLVSHAPPRGIHDNPDIAHKGWSALLSFIDRFKPAIALHGHTHRYDPTLPLRTRRGQTEIINAYGHVLLDLARDDASKSWQLASASLRS